MRNLAPRRWPSHVQKCKMRADVMAEHEALLELRKIEGPRPKLLPDWPKCKNCGEPYGPHAIGPHEARCCKLLPHGANGFGPQDHAKDPKFKHLYKASNIGVEERANEGLAEQAARSLSDLGKSMGSLLAYLGPSMTQAELDRLRKLFDRFDSAPKDQKLDMEEYAMLMRNVFPTRVADAESIVAMFKEADVDGNGTIDFPEFARMYVEMRDTEIDPRFEEACRMFDFFDADKSGELDPDEFLCLLNQVFPEYCEENEARAVEQFEEADSDGSGGISFAEFIAFYDILKRIYDNYDKGPSAEELAAIEAEEEARRLAELDAALIQCNVASPSCRRCCRNTSAHARRARPKEGGRLRRRREQEEEGPAQVGRVRGQRLELVRRVRVVRAHLLPGPASGALPRL